MLVNSCTDIKNVQMRNFAARHNAKIVQRAKDDVKGEFSFSQLQFLHCYIDILVIINRGTVGPSVM